MPSDRPRRRIALAVTVCGLLVLAGCFGASPFGGGPAGTDATVTPAPDPAPAHRSVGLAYDGDYYDPPGDADRIEEAASVEFRSSSVVVTGRIRGIGDRPCLTMDARATRFGNGTLAVRVSPGPEVPESKRGCNGSAALYDYRAVVESDSTPERVVVTHDGGFRYARANDERPRRDGTRGG